MRREKYSSQADPEILDKIRKVAKQEGRQFQAVVEDAMREYLDRREAEQVREDVISHFRKSVERNRRLGELLAK